MIRTRLAHERGSALVAALLVMTTIMALGMAMMTSVDTQSHQSGSERGRESAFNWAEAVLNAQTFTVANYWPASQDKGIMDCTWSGSGTPTASNGNVNACPDPAVISSSFTGNPDVARKATWKTSVRDNSGISACEDSTATNCSYTWNDSTTMSNANYDSNGDDLVWLRAEGTVNKDRRIVVALVRIANDPINLPQAAVIAGSLSVKGGQKTLVDEAGSVVALRCAATDTNCFNEQKPENVQGAPPQYGYSDGGHVMTADQIDQMRTKAKVAKTYFPAGTCPSTAAQASGAVVFIENATCQINANWDINKPPLQPGLLIVNQGRLTFNGTANFWGLVYMVNAQGAGPSDLPLFDGIGNFTLHGALFVDGAGTVNDQGSFQLQYDATALNNVTAYGATGIVPNSFREINP